MFNGNNAMHEVRRVAAAIEIRTHEDWHAPPGLQPLQVAVLRKAQSRSCHPPRAGTKA